MELELAGPRVSVDRNGTADRGGGQLIVKQGKLLVRTRNLERLLGASVAIDHIQLLDLARLRAQVRFVDGQVWNVESEQGEDLTPFFRQVESTAGRAGLLLRDPPRISDLARAAATPARVRTGLLTALALGVTIAGVLVYSSASARSAREQAQARERAAATERAQALAAHEQQQARERRTQADALAARLREAMHGERFRDASALRDQLVKLVPDDATAKQVSPQLERALADLDERERVAGVARGIVQARAMASDTLACETAKRVADANALLRRAQPSDADYDAARRALDGLERCRKRVRARFAQGAEESRRRVRMVSATQAETAVRRLGYPTRVTLAGRSHDVLRIEGRELDAAAARRILGLQDRKDTSFEAARTDDGFTRIEIRGDKFTQDVALHPLSPDALVLPVLEKFGLASPLALPAER